MTCSGLQLTLWSRNRQRSSSIRYGISFCITNWNFMKCILHKCRFTKSLVFLRVSCKWSCQTKWRWMFGKLVMNLDHYSIILKFLKILFFCLGVIYLKNFINQNWAIREGEDASTTFSIHEQDRAMIRDSIVDAAVLAPEIIRY